MHMHACVYVRAFVCALGRMPGPVQRGLWSNAHPRPLRYAWFVIARWVQSITYRFRRCLRGTGRVAARCRISRLRAWVEECVGGLVGGGGKRNTREGILRIIVNADVPSNQPLHRLDHTHQNSTDAGAGQKAGTGARRGKVV